MDKPQAVDLLKTDEDEVLERLGRADWLIALPEDLPDLIITTQWRCDLQADCARRFVRWVMQGIDRVLTHDYDPPWDTSGSLRQIKTDPLMLLVRHKLLSDWAEHEYTGHSEATYMSGMGLMWLTYHQDIENDIQGEVTEYFVDYCVNHWNMERESESFADCWEDSDIPWIIPRLTSVLVKDVLQLSTADAWKQFEADIIAENEARRKKAEQYQYQQQQVHQFWELHFPDLMRMRIEMPLFREMDLEQRIAEVLADADPQIVRMMAEVRLPGNYSLTVEEHIKEIVRRANL